MFAVVSLMTGAINTRLTNAFFESSVNETGLDETEARLVYSTTVVSSLALLVGILQVNLSQ